MHLTSLDPYSAPFLIQRYRLVKRLFTERSGIDVTPLTEEMLRCLHQLSVLSSVRVSLERIGQMPDASLGLVLDLDPSSPSRTNATIELLSKKLKSDGVGILTTIEGDAAKKIREHYLFRQEYIQYTVTTAVLRNERLEHSTLSLFEELVPVPEQKIVTLVFSNSPIPEVNIASISESHEELRAQLFNLKRKFRKTELEGYIAEFRLVEQLIEKERLLKLREETIKQTNQVLTEILASRSMQITAPMRAAMNFLRQIKLRVRGNP